MIGIIRVITTDDADILNEHGKLIESKYGVQTVSACIPDQPYGICDEVTERQAVRKSSHWVKGWPHQAAGFW